MENEFFLSIRDHLQSHRRRCLVLFTADPRSRVAALVRSRRQCGTVTDQLQSVALMDGAGLATTVADDAHRTSQLSEAFTWEAEQPQHPTSRPSNTHQRCADDILNE